MEENKRIFVPLELAIILIGTNELIHTYRIVGINKFLGCTYSRSDLIKKMEMYKDKLEIGGDNCRKLKHGLVLFDNYGYMFIEADEDMINKIETDFNKLNHKN